MFCTNKFDLIRRACRWFTLSPVWPLTNNSLCYTLKRLIGFCLANLRAPFYAFSMNVVSRPVARLVERTNCWSVISEEIINKSVVFTLVLILNGLACVFVRWFAVGARMCVFFLYQCEAFRRKCGNLQVSNRFYDHYTCFIVVHFATAFFVFLLNDSGWHVWSRHLINALWTLIGWFDWILCAVQPLNVFTGNTFLCSQSVERYTKYLRRSMLRVGIYWISNEIYYFICNLIRFSLLFLVASHTAQSHAIVWKLCFSTCFFICF